MDAYKQKKFAYVYTQTYMYIHVAPVGTPTQIYSGQKAYIFTVHECLNTDIHII